MDAPGKQSTMSRAGGAAADAPKRKAAEADIGDIVGSQPKKPRVYCGGSSGDQLVEPNTSIPQSAQTMVDPQIAREFELMGNPNTLIRIPDYHQLLMPLKGIQPTVKFHIHTDPDSPRPGLEISSMPKTVACVQMAYIYCRAYGNPDPAIPMLNVMRVSEEQLKSTLKNMDHTHFLLIGVFPDKIRLEFYDLDKGSDGTEITLHQLHDVTDQDDYDMVPMKFSYVMPIDAKQFHKVIKLISNWKSDFSEFILYKKQTNDPSVTHLYTVIQSANDGPDTTVVRKWFKSTVKRSGQHRESEHGHRFPAGDDADAEENEDDGLVTVNEVIEIIQEDLEPHLSPLPQFEKMTQVYREAFPTTYMEDFSTDIGHNDLRVYLEPEGPLMLETKKGSRSWLRLVIARKTPMS